MAATTATSTSTLLTVKGGVMLDGRLADLPNALLTLIWRLFDLRGIIVSLMWRSVVYVLGEATSVCF
jgi:hypothetical protein